MRHILKNLLTATALAGAIAATPALASDFYKGKTVNFVVGYAPGGGSDLTCRLFANHMSKYVEGNPNIVVRNMPGASGANAINYVGEAARPDGLNAICGTLSILLPMLDDPALRVDLTKFQFVAGVSDSQVFFVRSDVGPGLKTGQDIFNVPEFTFGGFRVTANKDLPARLAMHMLGLKYKYVTGINGDGAGRTAVQQNFVHGWLEGLASYVTITDPTMVKTGMVVPLFQTGLLNDKGELNRRDAALPGVPTFVEFYEQKFGKKPSGPHWDAYYAVLAPYAVSQRSLAFPPGTPPEAVKAMRDAFDKMLKDPAFLADAAKVLGEGAEVFGADRVQDTFVKALSPSDAIKQVLRAMVESGNAATRK